MSRRTLKSSERNRIEVAADRLSSRPETVVVVCVGAVTGAITGFLLAGEIRLGLGVFVAAFLGLLGGWWARGISGTAPREDAE